MPVECCPVAETVEESHRPLVAGRDAAFNPPFDLAHLVLPLITRRKKRSSLEGKCRSAEQVEEVQRSHDHDAKVRKVCQPEAELFRVPCRVRVELVEV